MKQRSITAYFSINQIIIIKNNSVILHHNLDFEIMQYYNIEICIINQ